MGARRLLLACARMGWVGGAVSFALRHFSRVLPVKRVYEDERVIGFLHPAPSYEPHVLIVPRARFKTVFDLGDAEFMAAARAAERIVSEGGWDVKLFQLRINGGSRQDVMQAHFHLIPASGVFGTPVGGMDGMSARIAGLDRARGFSVVFYIDGAAGRVRGEAVVQS